MDLESLKEIPFLSEEQLSFLKDLKSVIEGKILNNPSTGLTVVETKDFEVLKKIIVIAENLGIIIEQLKRRENERLKFIENYPEFMRIYKECIDKLREISKIMEKDRFNCNVSRVVGHCVSFIGGALTLTSGILIPFTAGLSTPFAIAGGAVTISGSSTSFGTAVTEKVRANKLIKAAQNNINENEQCFMAMADYLEHEKKLTEALSEILKIDIVKNVIPGIKKFVGKGMKIKNHSERLVYIEKNVLNIIKDLKKDIAETVPQIAVITIVSLLSAIFVSMWYKENQFALEHKAMHAKSILEIVSISDEIFDWVGLITGKAAFAKSIVKAATRGTVGALSMAIDGAGIVLTSIEIHKGSPSSHAKKIATAANELEKELEILQEVRGNLD